MILRRVIEHFRKQEWTAIAIDFLIVVLGVFIGIQVSNWNAARQMKAEQHSILVRLLAEAEEGVYYWRKAVSYAEGGLATSAVSSPRLTPAPSRRTAARRSKTV